MLVKKFINYLPVIKSNLFKIKWFNNNNFIFTESNSNEIITPQQKSILIQKILRPTNLKKQSSIILEDSQQQILRKKSLKLTKQDKLKLGLYVPKMALNPRMGLEHQSSYRQIICENLYDLQKMNLQKKVRILQKSTDLEHFTMDKYINAVYKDIYARYLVGKGVGVQWSGRYSTYGMLNSKKLQGNPNSLITNFLRANMDQFQKIQSIAPYSYLQKKFIPSQVINAENLRKIGHYFRLNLTSKQKDFGRHSKQFDKIQQRGSKIQLLIFCQYLQKMINPHCLCITPGQKMLILKQLILQKTNQSKKSSIQLAKQLKYEYLITSLEIFNKHKQYFQNKKYQKHLIFQSDHLIGMKAQYENIADDNKENSNLELQIISQISVYQRNPGIYLVNGSTSIPDYQRVQVLFSNNKQNDLQLKNIFDPSGNMTFKLNGQIQSLSMINNLQFQQRLLQILKPRFKFQQLYDVFQDQVYSNKKTQQALKFRLFDKYQLPIKNSSYKTLEQYLSNNQNKMILFESKIKIPKKQQFKKPKERRDFKKQVKEILKQRTEYMSLKQSIRSVQNVPITSSIQGDFKVWIERDENGNVINLHQDTKENQIKAKQKSLEKITISTDLISAISYIHSTENQNSSQLSQILIEPQTFTEEILPLCLHLIFFRTKISPSQDQPKRGRKRASIPLNQERINQSAFRILQSIKMIHLHPTIKQSQKQIDVRSFIMGSMKISNKHDFGYGFEAVRLWVCKHSDYMGDRQIKQSDVNLQLKNSAFIRKLYAQIIPLLPKQQLLQQIESNFQLTNLNLLDKFMLAQIDAYILNMEHFYSHLMIKQAYELTIDFYQNVIEQIFLQTVRKNIITYPNEKQNLKHGVTIKRILELLSVIAPLFPFTAYHVSKTQIMRWPLVDKNSQFYKDLLEYNSLIRIRTQLRNKLQLNNFKHSQIIFPLNKLNNDPNSNNNLIEYNQNDLRLFFGVDKISYEQPEIKQKSFGLKMRHNQSLGGKNKIYVYESKEYCIRCDPHSKQKQHLCNNCLSYLQENVGREVEFYDKKNNSLLKDANIDEQIANKSDKADEIQ